MLSCMTGYIPMFIKTSAEYVVLYILIYDIKPTFFSLGKITISFEEKKSFMWAETFFH